MTNGPVVVAYSGGLDTSWCVGWLAERGHNSVVAVHVDVGGVDDAELKRMEKRARALGATDFRSVDARRPFFDEIVQFLIMGNVLRGQLYPLCVGAERSLQAREVARVARELGATSVVHGCTAAGNDQIRFERALRTVAPELEIVAPVRDLAPAREEEVSDLARWGCTAFEGAKGEYSINSGLWGVTIGGAETLGSEQSIPESAWVRTRGAFDEPRPAGSLTIGFSAGVPHSIDGETLDPVTVIERVDALAARFGIGRGIHLGDTLLGIKGRVAFEAPAATVLIAAHRELEKLTLSSEQQSLGATLGQQYGELVHHGRFLERVCRDIEACFRSAQQSVTGEVSIVLRPGHAFVEGVTSPFSLMEASSAAYGESAGDWSPADAAGFAKIVSMPGVLQARSGLPLTGVPFPRSATPQNEVTA